ncbi:MAG: hypothetical protein HWE34_04320 [Methylocystaceae bacterium]|nr:hypothetical protein [Methylocystaceae bacterium]
MDMERNELMRLANSDEHKEYLARHSRQLEEMKTSNRQQRRAAERLEKDGPPIFFKDEVVHIKGHPFRIARIDSKKLILRPVRVTE